MQSLSETIRNDLNHLMESTSTEVQVNEIYEQIRQLSLNIVSELENVKNDLDAEIKRLATESKKTARALINKVSSLLNTSLNEGVTDKIINGLLEIARKVSKPFYMFFTYVKGAVETAIGGLTLLAGASGVAFAMTAVAAIIESIGIIITGTSLLGLSYAGVSLNVATGLTLLGEAALVLILGILIAYFGFKFGTELVDDGLDTFESDGYYYNKFFEKLKSQVDEYFNEPERSEKIKAKIRKEIEDQPDAVIGEAVEEQPDSPSYSNSNLPSTRDEILKKIQAIIKKFDNINYSRKTKNNPIIYNNLAIGEEQIRTYKMTVETEDLNNAEELSLSLTREIQNLVDRTEFKLSKNVKHQNNEIGVSIKVRGPLNSKTLQFRSDNKSQYQPFDINEYVEIYVENYEDDENQLTIRFDSAICIFNEEILASAQSHQSGMKFREPESYVD